MKNEQQEISICLNDIPREKMRKNGKGNIYVSLTVAERREPDQWGRNLKVYISQTKSEREKNEQKIYVGGGKTIIFESEEQQPPSAEDLDKLYNTPTDENKDDLPFPPAD